MSDIIAQNEKSVLARQDKDSWRCDPEEQIALLGGRLVWKTNKRNGKYWKIGMWMWTIVSTVVAVILICLYTQDRIVADKFAPTEQPKLTVVDELTQNGKRNLIFMVSDGMGPASLTLTRGYYQNITEGSHFSDTLGLDKHLVGTHRTRSHDEPVSDSAAGATAFATRSKTYNGGVSVNSKGLPLDSVLEAAHKAGYVTGIVVTTSITDATPATFASHVKWRKTRDSIAEQLIGLGPLGRSVDLIIGGGRCHFLPKSLGKAQSCREDNKNLVEGMKGQGWKHYIDEKVEFDKELPGLPLLALLAPERMPYEIDREHRHTHRFPSIAEMTEKALELLHTASLPEGKKGFFLVVEGSQIDNTSHDNDAAAHVREVLAYDKAFRAARDFLKRNKISGNVVSTSDHETGGLSAGIQLDDRYPKPYRWNPSELADVHWSAKSLGKEWLAYLQQKGDDKPSAAKNATKAIELLERILTHPDAPPTKEELDTILNFDHGRSRVKDAIRWPFAEVVSRRALVGWATHGHSAVDANVYAYSTESKDGDRADVALRGNQENTNIGKFLSGYLQVTKEQAQITKELQANPPDLGGFPELGAVLAEFDDDEYDEYDY